MDLPAEAMFPGLAAVPWYGWRSTAEVEALGAAAASQLGCGDPGTALDCLRRLPVGQLFAQAQPFQPYAFGEEAGQVQAHYPLSAYPSPAVAWATVLTDRMWARSTLALQRLLAQHVPVYASEFADGQAPMYLPFPPDLPPGAFHAAEVP
jgi:para-nitrobenzyl esterase